MERFLAWVVTAMFSWFFRLIAYPIFSFAFRVANRLYSYSESLFWVIIVLAGSTLLAFLVLGIISGCNFVVTVSQKMCKSRSGIRYTIIGIVCIANYIIALTGISRGSIKAPPAQVLAYIVCIFYNVVLIFVGRIRAKEECESNPEEKSKAKNSTRGEMPRTYTVDDEYVNYLMSGNPELTREEGREFYSVLITYQVQGKEEAIASFSKIVHRIAEGDLLHAAMVVSYLCGALAANGVLTKEESDSLSEKYRNALLDLLEQERKEEQTQA